jgi:polyferredoxin
MKNRSTASRLIVQSVFFFVSMAILAFVIIVGSKAIHNACPYASVCFGLDYHQILGLSTKVFLFSTLLGFAILISSIFIGRKFCSWICPLGSIQEAVFQLRNKRYRIKQQVPFYIEHKFAFVKYLILIVTALSAAAGMAYLFIRFCPFYALSMLPRIAIPGLALLAVILVAGFFTERFWCRFLCPYAALLNIFQAIGKLFGIRRMKILRNWKAVTTAGSACFTAR